MMNKGKREGFLRYIKERFRQDKAFCVITAVFLAYCYISAIYFFAVAQTRNGVLSIGYSLFVLLIFLCEYGFRMRLVPLFAATVLLIGVGGLLGSAYNVYTYVPCFDIILHCISGFIFGCLGFMVLELFLGEPKSTRQFVACVAFGLFFSLAIAVLWELFEYTAYALTGVDMQEDTIVRGFASYLLSGTHNEAVVVEGIEKTVIYLKDGSTVTIDGYLDLGLIDTIGDLAICLAGAIVYLIAFLIDCYHGRRLYRLFIPKILNKNGQTAQDTDTSVNAL